MTAQPHSGSPSSRRDPDWERIGAQYRIGTMSLREIAFAHGISEGAIRKRAKRDSWTRDLSARVWIKADGLVRKELVRSQVRMQSSTEKVEIEIEANVVARVRLSHRRDIAAARGLVRSLFSELEQLSPDLRLVDDIKKALAEFSGAGTLPVKAAEKLTASLRQALSLGARANIAKSLMDALRTSVNLEREAFGMDTPGREPEGDALTTLLRGMQVRSLPVIHDDPAYKVKRPQ